MAIALSYPGVYVVEKPSGVRTITGVATSITAFVGRTRKGPTNKATTVNSYGEFESIFGGLWEKSSLAFAVRDFFLNGGGVAVIVRLFNAEPSPAISKASIKAGGQTFESADEGSWGEKLTITIDDEVSEVVAKSIGLAKSDLFNLNVVDGNPGGATEKFRNVTVKDGPRRIDKVLKAESRLLRVIGAPVSANPVTIAKDAKPSGIVSDGIALTKADFDPVGARESKAGLYALEQVDLFNLLCIPPYLDDVDVDATLIAEAAKYCEDRRAMLLVDAPTKWSSVEKAIADADVGTVSKNAAVFFPRLQQPNPLHDNQMETFVPCGAVAGVMARTDATRGVWKAPAGLEATLNGVPGLSLPLTDMENGRLNPLGINCLRAMPAAGRVVWGARTLQGNDRLASEWKYIPVRRLALFIEESLYRGTQWVVFEPNDEPLWSQIRLNLGAFMHGLFRQGAFQGMTPKDAYFVKCDKETTTQNDINLGIVNIVVGFAPLKPAEFVVIQIQQMAGQIQT
jgi:uncharacterized protein